MLLCHAANEGSCECARLLRAGQPAPRVLAPEQVAEWRQAWRLARPLELAGLAGSAVFAAGRRRAGSFRRAARSGRVDHADDRLNRHGLAFADFDFLEHARRRRRNFRVNFIGRDFERGSSRSTLSPSFSATGDGAFENAFAHLGHYDVNGHVCLLENPQLKRRTRRPYPHI